MSKLQETTARELLNKARVECKHCGHKRLMHYRADLKTEQKVPCGVRTCTCSHFEPVAPTEVSR